jgi:hypothetical protein
MTGPDGYELSDRWEEAQLLMRLCAGCGAGSNRKSRALHRLKESADIGASVRFNRVSDLYRIR